MRVAAITASAFVTSFAAVQLAQSPEQPVYLGVTIFALLMFIAVVFARW